MQAATSSLLLSSFFRFNNEHFSSHNKYTKNFKMQKNILNFKIKICNNFINYENNTYNLALLQFFSLKFSMILTSWPENLIRSWQHCWGSRSSYSLKAALNTQYKDFFLFWVIWAASGRRLKSLPNSDLFYFWQKKSPKIAFLQGKCLKQNDLCMLG